MVQRKRTNRKVSSWSDEEIRGLINGFIEKNGRIPNTKDLKTPGMPPKRIFRITAAEWLLANYGPSALSYEERRAKYAEDFRAEYMKLMPRTSDEYNERKNPALPRWEAVRNHYPDDFTCWTKMLEYFGLPRYNDLPKEPKSATFHVELVWH